MELVIIDISHDFDKNVVNETVTYNGEVTPRRQINPQNGEKHRVYELNPRPCQGNRSDHVVQIRACDFFGLTICFRKADKAAKSHKWIRKKVSCAKPYLHFLPDLWGK